MGSNRDETHESYQTKSFGYVLERQEVKYDRVVVQKSNPLEELTGTSFQEGLRRLIT